MHSGAAACEGGSSAPSLPAANSDAVAPVGAGAWAGAGRSPPPFLSGIPTSAGLVAAFLGQVVWVAARADPASPPDDLAAASGRACSAPDDFVLSSDRFGRYSSVCRLLLSDSEVCGSDHPRRYAAAPSAVVGVCTDRSAFVGCCSEILGARPGVMETSADRQGGEVSAVFVVVGLLDSAVSSAADAAVSDQAVSDLVVRVFDLVED